MWCVNFKPRHIAINNDVDSVLLTCGRESIIINRLINYRPGRIVNLPLATINIDLASLIEVEVDVMQAESNLANGIADESLQRKIFWDAMHNDVKPPNVQNSAMPDA
jgi:hypothetical protein